MKTRYFALALCAFVVLPVAAQPYPNKPIRMIVSLPAGGGVDIMARLIAQPLSVRLGQQIIVRETPHAHGEIDDFALPRHAWPLGPADDGNHVEVRARREATVQPQFLEAEMPPRLEGAEVEKAEVDGLLQFVGEVSGEEHAGDVGLDQADLFDPVGIGAGLEQ